MTFIMGQTLCCTGDVGQTSLLTLYLMERASSGEDVPDGILVSFQSHLEFNPKSTPPQLLPFSLSPVKRSWYLLFFGLACLRAFALAVPFAWNALPRYLPGLLPQLIHVSAIKTFSLIDLNKTAASNQPSSPYSELLFIALSTTRYYIICIYLCSPVE